MKYNPKTHHHATSFLIDVKEVAATLLAQRGYHGINLGQESGFVYPTNMTLFVPNSKDDAYVCLFYVPGADEFVLEAQVSPGDVTLVRIPTADLDSQVAAQLMVFSFDLLA